MNSLKEYIYKYSENKKAIGHFNVSNLEMLKAVTNVAVESGEPVIVGVSEGERDFIGLAEISMLIKNLRESKNLPIFLNADHTYSFEKVKEAILAGFDSVIFDGAGLPIEKNIEESKKCVEFAKNYTRSTGREVLIEGELGFIGKSSQVIEAVPVGAAVDKENMTKPEDALVFVKETGIDLLAPAVGNVHGFILGGGNPDLDINRIEEIKKSVGLPLVLHGGSGIKDDQITSAVKNGCSVVHFSTELRMAWRGGLVKALSENPDEMAPYKYLKVAILDLEKVILNKINLIK